MLWINAFIQSIYHEFGSGVVLPDTGIVWQNRGASFSLDPAHLLALAPGKQPFHTLNPAAARLNDGRVMVYGSMGGDGQPQTQATLFTRYVVQGLPLQESISRPRWLLGRTWGQSSDTLKVEGRFSPETIARLQAVSGGAAVAARVERAFKQPVRVAYNCARVAHGFAKVREDLHLVTQRLQACDRFRGKPAFHF